MSKRIETEKKYFCANSEDLISKINAMDLELISDAKESDEYFTDINSDYIKTRTCLRIRKRNDKMQVTFKGKSKDFSNSFCKLESNYNINNDNYDDFVTFLSNLGYYSYTIVNKNRYTYQKKEKNYTYSIMVDNIDELGGFVEFELLSEDENYDEFTLKTKLNKFISKFSDLNLEEANLPYRDYVALRLYNDYMPKKDIMGIHLNIDSFLKDYEKGFYKFYKSIVKTSKTMRLQGFRNSIYDVSEDERKKLVTYFDNLKIQDSNFVVMFELLKQLKKLDLNIILSTNCNEEFVNTLFNTVFKVNVFSNIIYLKNNKAIYSELLKNNIDLKNYFNISKLNLKNTNSILLVIINNFGITNK